jgi:hypothetical protein
MKKSLLMLAVLAATLTASVQSALGQENPDQMSIRVAGYEVLLNGKKDGSKNNWKDGFRRQHKYGGRIGTFELGFGGLRATPSAYAAYPDAERGFMDLNMAKSIHVGINLFTFSSRLTRDNTLGVTWGIGLSSSNFMFDTPTTFTKQDKLVHPVEVDYSLKKSKLNTFAVRIPLAFEINPTRDFFFSVGGYADLMFGSHMKWKSPKDKLYRLGTNFLQAGLTARVGARNIYAFANYGMVDLFRNGRGPVVSPYTFGIGFGF